MSNKSALGIFSPYNPDYGKNAALVAFGATMLQNAGRQPFGRGAPMTTAQGVGSAALAGLGAYTQAEQQQYARTKPNYQVINDKLVSITPPTERGGTPTVEEVANYSDPTIIDAPTTQDFYDAASGTTIKHQWDGEKWIPIGDQQPIGNKQWLVRNGEYTFGHFKKGDQPYVDKGFEWVMRGGEQVYAQPQVGDKKYETPEKDKKQWVIGSDGTQYFRIPVKGDSKLTKESQQWVINPRGEIRFRVPEIGDKKYMPNTTITIDKHNNEILSKRAKLRKSVGDPSEGSYNITDAQKLLDRSLSSDAVMAQQPLIGKEDPFYDEHFKPSQTKLGKVDETEDKSVEEILEEQKADSSLNQQPKDKPVVEDEQSKINNLRNENELIKSQINNLENEAVKEVKKNSSMQSTDDLLGALELLAAHGKKENDIFVTVIEEELKKRGKGSLLKNKDNLRNPHSFGD